MVKNQKNNGSKEIGLVTPTLLIYMLAYTTSLSLLYHRDIESVTTWYLRNTFLIG